MGNGDTYHTTNCSPQVAGFNRAANGEDNWGDLENLVIVSEQFEYTVPAAEGYCAVGVNACQDYQLYRWLVSARVGGVRGDLPVQDVLWDFSPAHYS